MSKPQAISSKTALAVRHADEFKHSMSLVSDAAIGVVLIRTREPDRCIEVLHEWAIAQEKHFKVWTTIHGWQTFASHAADDGSFGKAASKDGQVIPAKALDSMMSDFPGNGCFVMRDIQHWLEQPYIQAHIKEHVKNALTVEKRLVLLVPESTKIPSEVEDSIHIVEFKTPSQAELLEGYERMIENLADGSDPDEPNCRPKFSDGEIATIVQNATGMTAHEFDTSLATAFVELRDRLAEAPESVTADEVTKIVLQSKIEVIKKSGILEFMASAKMGDVGGLDALKTWVRKRRPAFSDNAKKFGVDKPKGILCVGPPGTGKSLIAKAVANNLGIPGIKFDIGRVFGKYVGDSESQMRRALSIIEAVAPCVLIVDEIDKAFGGMSGGGGDGGTTARVFGTFLTWMQERDSEASPIFVVATANNIEGLPPELMRKGRFDEIFAVTFPDEKERVEILDIHLSKRFHKMPPAELRKVARVTEKFVGAELEGIVKEATTDAFNEYLIAMGVDPTSDEIPDVDPLTHPVTTEHLIRASEGIVPISKAFAERVRHMNEWAKNNAKPASSTMRFDEHEEPGIKKTDPDGEDKPARPSGPIRRGPLIRPKLKPQGGAARD